jgi:CheY-like chemotaxis protein
MPRPSTILIAGDDLFFAARLSAAVRACGHEAQVAHTGAGLRRALRANPAAVILNLASRGFDAVAAIAEARADAATRGVPFLGFCGHADTARREAARAAGCDMLATNGEISAHLPRLLTALLRPPQPATPSP